MKLRVVSFRRPCVFCVEIIEERRTEERAAYHSVRNSGAAFLHLPSQFSFAARATDPHVAHCVLAITIIPGSSRGLLMRIRLFLLSFCCASLLLFQSGDDNPFVYSTPTSDWDVLEDFEPGQIIEIDIIFTNYHWVSDRACWRP